MNKKVNLNQQVKVKLTDHGKTILLRRAESQANEHDDIEIKQRIYDYYKCDKNGFNKFLLWEIGNIFGSFMYNGCKCIFENNLIEIEGRDKCE